MIQIKLEIGGKERDLFFTQGVNILIKDKFLSYDKDERVAFGIQLITWAALKIGCVVKDIPCDFSFADVYQWSESLPVSDKERISEAYNEMIAYEANIKEEPSESEKKNLPDIVTEQNATNLQDG